MSATLTATHALTTAAVPAAPSAETPGGPTAARSPQLRGLVPEQSTAAHLLDEAAAGPDDRVLIVGATSAELLCAALRHGCRAAQEAAVPPKRPEPADVVVAPHITSEEDAAAVASCARRALAESRTGGRLALVLLGAGARALARSMTRRLRAYGFERVRLHVQAGGDLLLVCRLQPVTATSSIARR